MEVTMDKKYNYKNGEVARILCTDRPFSGEIVNYLNKKEIK